MPGRCLFRDRLAIILNPEGWDLGQHQRGMTGFAVCDRKSCERHDKAAQLCDGGNRRVVSSASADPIRGLGSCFESGATGAGRTQSQHPRLLRIRPCPMMRSSALPSAGLDQGFGAARPRALAMLLSALKDRLLNLSRSCKYVSRSSHTRGLRRQACAYLGPSCHANPIR